MKQKNYMTLRIGIYIVGLSLASGLQARNIFPQETSLQMPGTTPSITTLRASARLTIVDVTAVDSKGQPIDGLKAADFHVLEDGKEQPIRNFEELSAEVGRPVHEHPALPLNVYTNLQPAPSSTSVNVLLLDALNTKLTDQAFVKTETLKYLKSMTPGTRIAIMTLSNQLRLVQGFTADPEVLAAALKGKNNRTLPSPLLNEDLADSNDTTADIIDAGAAASLQAFANEISAFQADVRNRMTLEALDQIAAYLTTIPGRKNLIWFSSGMPLQIFPNGADGNIATMNDYTRELRKTTDLLTAAQIAVYPVDAQGLHGNMEGSATKGGSGFAGGRGGAAAAASYLAFLNKTANQQLSMVAVAEATGGVAYFNTNGLGVAVGKAVANGANYYAISYTPPTQTFDGTFHKITVKTDHAGAHLAYRIGYYSDDVAHNAFTAAETTPVSASVEPNNNDMAASMRRGVPTSSQILFDVKVEPHAVGTNPPGTAVIGTVNPKLATKPLKRYDIHYIFPGRQIQFTESPEHIHRGSLQFQIAAYDVQGQLLSSISQSVDLPLSTELYNKLQRSPFQFSQQLDVPSGDIFLRFGIRDATSEKIGTLEIPLSVSGKDGPALTAPPTRSQEGAQP